MIASVSAACGEAEGWRGGLDADSPCYEVNLLDGVSRATTRELHGLFACLNHHGHLDPLVPVDRALDRTAPDGTPVGLLLVDAVGALSGHEVDLGSVLEVVRAALAEPEDPVTTVVDVALELAYGRPAADLRQPGAALRGEEALRASPLQAAAPLASLTALALTDAPDTLDALADVVGHPNTPVWLWTAESFLGSTHPDLQGPLRGLTRDLGVALRDAGTDGDDRTPDLLRATATALLADDARALDGLAPPLHAILADRAAREGFEDALVSWNEDGHLAALPGQLAWLASVDRAGGLLEPGEISALGAFLRMVADANRPMRCTLDLGLTDVTLDLGNVALVVLSVLADADPDLLLDATDLLGDVLGFPLTAGLLDQIARSGVCPVLTPRLVDDIAAVEVLDAPQSRHLLIAMIDLLRVLRDDGAGHLDDVADLATALVDRDLLPTTEALVRVLGPQPLVETIVGLAPVLARPAAWSIRHPATVPADLQDALDLVLGLLAPRADGDGRELHRWLPLLQRVLLDDAAWETLSRLPPLLTDPRTALADLPARLPALLALDPDLAVLAPAAALLRDRSVTTPLLAAIGEGTLVAELVATRPTGDDPRAPVPWLAELATDGTLDDLLALVSLGLGALDELNAPATD